MGMGLVIFYLLIKILHLSEDKISTYKSLKSSNIGVNQNAK